MTYRNALNAIDLRLQFNIALHLIPCFQYSRVDLQAKVRFSKQEISRAAETKKLPQQNQIQTTCIHWLYVFVLHWICISRFKPSGADWNQF